MKRIILLLFISLTLFACNQNTQPDPETEYIRWQMGGKSFEATNFRKDFSASVGNISLGEDKYLFGLDLLKSGGLQLNTTYTESTLNSFGIGFDDNKIDIDTMFSKGTFKMTRNDATFLEAEFTGTDGYLVNDTDTVKNHVGLSITGTIKLKK